MPETPIEKIISITIQTATTNICAETVTIESYEPIQTEITVKNITFLAAGHGQGIAEKDKPYIFDRIYCADK